ncbi:hypothetical protein BDZ97DRAFT_2054307 [Flammula alnicola]|nr:hypothetical protein BDZ97DRAFT_2054307 [Flammula alnicola]
MSKTLKQRGELSRAWMALGWTIDRAQPPNSKRSFYGRAPQLCAATPVSSYSNAKMHISSIGRSLFHKKKPASAKFPPNWPSHLHSKCTVKTCSFPNPPQAVEGKYNCLGRSGGVCCPGTYKVSYSMAATMTRNYVFLPLRQEVQKAPPPKKKKKRDYTQSKLKDLPPVPGLSERKVNRDRPDPPSQQRPPVIPNPTSTTQDHVHRQQMYPPAVQQYYFQPQDQAPVSQCRAISERPPQSPPKVSAARPPVPPRGPPLGLNGYPSIQLYDPPRRQRPVQAQNYARQDRPSRKPRDI